MRYFLSIIGFIVVLVSNAQTTDDFSDGNFTVSPVWSGDDSVFTVVDVSGDNHLRSNKLLPSTTFYLSTPSTLASDGQWEFFTNLQFNTSSLNYVDIYLTSDQSNLLSAGINGYFIRIGGTTDEISLYKKIGGTATKIIDGADGITNVSNNTLKIKVTCTASYLWTLERDNTGSGNSYVTEGTITDASVTTSSYFGVFIAQSTVSFIQKHFFDDFYIGPIIYDLTPPQLLSATPVSSTVVDLDFNELLDQVSAETALNYTLNPAVSVVSATIDALDASLVHLTLGAPLSNGTTYTVNSVGIADLALNASGNQQVQFTYLVAETPLPGDVIITEFLCDESPSVGLPGAEFVEIYNTSNKYFNLQNWMLGDASSDGTVQSVWLYPAQHLVLSSSTNAPLFSPSVGVTSFPSLNNAGDDVVLKDASGLVLDKISYTDQWYQDPLKADGGYSIERINYSDPCSGSDNWKASNAVSGGTPGLVNSVFDATPDTQAPSIIQLIALAPNFLQIYFNEGMDSTSLADLGVLVDPTLTLLGTTVNGTYPTMVTLQFAENFVGSQFYTITLQGVSDCWSNSVDLTGQFVLPEMPEPGDVVINEILYDPKTGAQDWIEVHNTSAKLIDLKDWQLANLSGGVPSNFKVITEHHYLKPGGFAVLGSDSLTVKQIYPFAIPGTFVQCETPTYSNDSATVLLYYFATPMDQVSYSDEWHFKLLDNTDGVSLERIDPNGISNDRNNWHSAAEAVGFATPGMKNSQYLPALTNGEFSFGSNTISPDNDGFEDVLQINYSMTVGGLLGKLVIYDDRGRLITELFMNELLGTTGTFTWDGITSKGVKASIGTYVAVFEAFSLDGATLYSGRKAFVVAGKL